MRWRTASKRAERPSENPWKSRVDFSSRQPPTDDPKDHAERTRLMLDMIALAFEADVTRVVTFMFGNSVSTANFSFLEGVDSADHHETSHHSDKPGLLDRAALRESGERRRMDQQHGAAVLELELDFRRSQPGVERHEDRTDEPGGEQGFQEGRMVLTEVRHPVALAHPAVPEGVREADGTLRELFVAELPRSGDDGGLRARLRAAPLQPRADAKILHGKSFPVRR